MNREEEKKRILNRLKTIKGHIGGVEKMIIEDKPCEDVVLQIGAIKASIPQVGSIIMEEYARKNPVVKNTGTNKNQRQIDMERLAQLQEERQRLMYRQQMEQNRIQMPTLQEQKDRLNQYPIRHR